MSGVFFVCEGVRNMKRLMFLIITGVAVFSSGCNCIENSERKITRVFLWGTLRSEADTARYAAAGVTDIQVYNQKSFNWAVKYGITPYCGCLSPAGLHKQVMTPEEQKLNDYIYGADLPKDLSKAERTKILHSRRREKNHRYGTSRVDPLDSIGVLPCFASDKNLFLTKKKIDRILKRAVPGVKGIYLDYFGYSNSRGCYCRECLARCQAYLKQKNLPDTQENKDIFYRKQLVDYYNQVVAYIKSKRPDFKVVAHFYPEFEPDPWYAKRTMVDFTGQTVSWYFKWQKDDIANAVKNILANGKRFNPNGEAVPFIGLNSNPKSSLGYKAPEDVERELKIIIDSGAETLMVCSGNPVIQPGYFEVFKKYCGKEK